MKNTYRILGLVACLLVVWMVTRGTNGCAMPDPDAEGTIKITTPAANLNEQPNAKVYLSGRLVTNPTTGMDKLNSSGAGDFPVKWHTALEGNTIHGVLTVIKEDSTTGATVSHTHAHFTLTKPVGLTSSTADVKLGKMVKGP